tara:strand:+ start:550 stop:924 length:375 start_codon:yes stop_codon:yes gene_type:complete
MGTNKTAPKFKAHTNRIVPLGQVGKANPAQVDTSLFNCSDPEHAYELGKIEGQTFIVDALRGVAANPGQLQALASIIAAHDKRVRDINGAAKRIKAASQRRADDEEELRMCELSHWGAQGTEEG